MGDPAGAVGLLSTAGNDTSVAEWTAALPPSVGLHRVRMSHDTDETDRAVKGEDLARCCESLAGADVDVVAYGCTVGSCIRPDSAGYVERTLAQRLSRPAITASGSVVAALDALGVESAAVSTPYTERKTAAIGRFLSANGVEVANVDNAGARLDSVHREGLAVDVDGADAVFVSCMNHPTFEAIPRLEATLEKPVVTSNQATLWHALRTMGVEDVTMPLGELFAH